MTNFKTIALAILLLITVSFKGEAQKKEKNIFISKQQANEEIQMVVKNILRHHPEPFHVTSKYDFYSVIDGILEKEDNITIGQHYFDLAQISSMIYDTHTQLHVTEETPGFKSTFPLRFRVFPDGVYIIAGNNDYRNAIGKKVISISGTDMDEVMDKLALFSAADNKPRQKVFAESFLYMPETYDVFNLKTLKGKIELRLEGINGKQSTVILSNTWTKGLADFSNDALNPFLPKELITVHDVFETEVPFYLKNIEDDYWWTFLDADKKTQYIQINKQYGEMTNKPSPEFHLDWMNAFWNTKVEILIIDLRNDPGGTIELTDALPGFLGYAAYLHPNLKGISALIGPDMVSAGTVLAARLEYQVQPLMIGSPSGSSPNMYLSAHKIELPYSKIVFEVSQSLFISSNENDTRAYIAPDIAMELSFEDYVNGRDPILEFAKTVNGELLQQHYKNITLRTLWRRNSQLDALK